jgi:hypothetical protein
MKKEKRGYATISCSHKYRLHLQHQERVIYEESHLDPLTLTVDRAEFKMHLRAFTNARFC